MLKADYYDHTPVLYERMRKNNCSGGSTLAVGEKPKGCVRGCQVLLNMSSAGHFLPAGIQRTCMREFGGGGGGGGRGDIKIGYCNHSSPNHQIKYPSIKDVIRYSSDPFTALALTRTNLTSFTYIHTYMEVS